MVPVSAADDKLAYYAKLFRETEGPVVGQVGIGHPHALLAGGG